MKLSIVATLYQSAPYIKEFYQRASDVAKQYANKDYEIILVNDGSPDNSLEIAIKLTEYEGHLTVIDLARNFGHHEAMMTGLAHAEGERIFLIDSDLEEEPEWLLTFADQMNNNHSDVVYGTQIERKGNYFERISGRVYYSIFRILTGLKQENNITTARLMSKRYVDSLLMHNESEINIGGLWIITGFNQCKQHVKKHATSPTSYSLSKKFSHLVNAITSFSSLPLKFTFYSGLLISTSALMYISYLIICYFFVAAPPDGYTSIIASIWLFSGFIIFFMGVQGIYISKIFSEVKQRPRTIIRHIYSSLNEEDIVE